MNRKYISAVKPLDNYILQVDFVSGSRLLLDMKPYLYKLRFRPLAEAQLWSSAVTNGIFIRFGNEVDAPVTPQLRELVQQLENASSNAKVSCLILRGGQLTLALQTRYVFAGIPPELDMRDIDGIRRWFTASLTGMGGLLDILQESPALTGAEK